jgi:geranylgeranyl transferase type-2 subunit beta
MAYLAELTLRLAAGVGRLPEEVRARHAAYLVAAQNADGGYRGREGASDLYYTGFALRGLALTGELHGPVAQRAAEFLSNQLHARVAIVDFLSLVYGAMLLETAAGIDVFAAAAPGWREAVAAELERFRRDDGGYAKTDEGASSSTYYSFLMILCLQLIGLPPVFPQRLLAFVRSRQREDGGFVEMGPMRRSGTNPTAAAVGLFKILDACDDPTREATLDFMADMQTDEGGLRANTRIPVADVLSTFTGLLTLGDLDGLSLVDLRAAERYVSSMELPGGGFRGGIWDDGTDVEYTFYGLGALALLENAKNGHRD